LATDPQQRFLYAGLRSSFQVSSFAIDQRTGDLTPIASIPLDADPCYLATDRRGLFLLSSYYFAGKVAVHRIAADGSVAVPPVESRATADHAHAIQTDPTNRFAFVPHTVEPNAIFQFRFDEETGQIEPNDVPKLVPETGDGPRHFCFHPSEPILYFVNEQGSSVTAYRLATETGTLSAFQTISTLPDGFAGENTCAQIHIALSGRSLYAANRGHDSIACFSIDASGCLTAIGQQPTEKTPRVFGLDPAGRWLFAAGLDTGRLATYHIDGQTGALAPVRTLSIGPRPMWVLLLQFAS
jgi:6-phosphogluconolactonase